MKSKLWFVGVSLIAMALLLVIAVNLLSTPTTSMTRPGFGVQNNKPNPGGNTARTAYQAAQTWAQTWAADAELVALSTTVEHVNTTSGWTLQLYSPAQRRIAVVLVTGESVQLLQEQAALYAQAPLPLAEWLQDSDVIFERWWQERGRQLWAQPEPHTLLLHLGEGDAGLTWQIIVLNRQGDLVEYREIAATTGDVLIHPQPEEE